MKCLQLTHCFGEDDLENPKSAEIHVHISLKFPLIIKNFREQENESGSWLFDIDC